jgi:hypothetical protein
MVLLGVRIIYKKESLTIIQSNLIGKQVAVEENTSRSITKEIHSIKLELFTNNRAFTVCEKL